ncbi:22K [Baboon adenovirus 3]|uniref:22K n=1 Tax=Simian mastadenovirus C TaxID=1962300 RepID=M9YY67_9ADEN|nr:22K [Baboon adenovirus 3]AGK27143.1 22K [Baboon adenovirus 3]AGK27215.1 22K [Simian mastadenovirus C]
MPPKGVKQLIAQQRAKKQQELLRHMEEEEEASDAWDSQAEEASEDEEMEGWDSLDEVEEEEEVEDEPIGEKPPASSALSPSRLAKTRVPTPGGSRKASRRWDTTGSPVASAAGKPGRPRRGYCSWRVHKSSIVNCLQHCGGNISFARRYLLYHHGVAVPRNVLYYYRHLYSPYETLGEKI